MIAGRSSEDEIDRMAKSRIRNKLQKREGQVQSEKEVIEKVESINKLTLKFLLLLLLSHM